MMLTIALFNYNMNAVNQFHHHHQNPIQLNDFF